MLLEPAVHGGVFDLWLSGGLVFRGLILRGPKLHLMSLLCLVTLLNLPNLFGLLDLLLNLLPLGFKLLGLGLDLLGLGVLGPLCLLAMVMALLDLLLLRCLLVPQGCSLGSTDKTLAGAVTATNSAESSRAHRCVRTFGAADSHDKLVMLSKTGKAARLLPETVQR